MTEATEVKSPDQTEVATPVKRGPGRPPTVKKEENSEPILVQTGVTEKPAPSGVVNNHTKFYRGKFSEKSNPNDADAVRLSVNGECITWQRGVDTIVPDCYLEVAEHAIFPKFKQEPGKGRKVAAHISRFPFTKTGTATYQEFRTEFLEGSKKTRAAVMQYGMNIPTADSIVQAM